MTATQRAIPLPVRLVRRPRPLSPGILMVGAVLLIPALLWLGARPLSARFASPTAAIQSLTNLLAVVGFSALALNLVLGGRLPVMDRLFDGLDRLYRVHRLIGRAVIFLIAPHALWLIGSAAWSSGLPALRILLPSGRSVLFAGLAALVGLSVALYLTVFARLRHETFVWVQRSFGLIFLVGAYHAFSMGGTKAASRPLTLYLAGLAAAGLAAWVYRSLLGGRLARRHRYRVKAVNRPDVDVVELVLAPEGEPVRHDPGQFLFISLDHPAVSREPHPFSIASAPDALFLRIVVKAAGDYTDRLLAIEPGAEARIEGAYGRFSHHRFPNRKQVWIAGGIGVTPFLSMARSLEHQDYEVDFYYCTEDLARSYYLDEFYAIADQDPRFRVAAIRRDALGLITAQDILAASGDLAEKDILICGPPPMIRSLRQQLVEAGIPPERIHAEGFDFR